MTDEPIKDEPIKLETENIFEPEEPKETTFDELIEDLPEPMANMMKGMEHLMGRIAPPFARFALPPREYKVRVIRFVTPDPEIGQQLEDMLKAGWVLGNWINTRDFVICIFSRELEQSKEGSTNG